MKVPRGEGSCSYFSCCGTPDTRGYLLGLIRTVPEGIRLGGAAATRGGSAHRGVIQLNGAQY